MEIGGTKRVPGGTSGIPSGAGEPGAAAQPISPARSSLTTDSVDLRELGWIRKRGEEHSAYQRTERGERVGRAGHEVAPLAGAVVERMPVFGWKSSVARKRPGDAGFEKNCVPQDPLRLRVASALLLALARAARLRRTSYGHANFPGGCVSVPPNGSRWPRQLFRAARHACL